MNDNGLIFVEVSPYRRQKFVSIFRVTRLKPQAEPTASAKKQNRKIEIAQF